jgi:hypothetical protein
MLPSQHSIGHQRQIFNVERIRARNDDFEFWPKLESGRNWAYPFTRSNCTSYINSAISEWALSNFSAAAPSGQRIPGSHAAQHLHGN